MALLCCLILALSLSLSPGRMQAARAIKTLSLVAPELELKPELELLERVRQWILKPCFSNALNSACACLVPRSSPGREMRKGTGAGPWYLTRDGSGPRYLFVRYYVKLWAGNDVTDRWAKSEEVVVKRVMENWA